MPHAFPRACRGGETGRLAGGGISGRDPGPFPVGDVRQADSDDPSQPPRPRGRGGAPQPTDRRCRPHGGLRQDGPRAPPRRDLRRSPCHLPPCRADARRPVPHDPPRERIGRLEILGRAAGGLPVGVCLATDRGGDRPFPRDLHDDGDGVDDGRDRRDARPGAPRLGDDSRRPFRPCPPRRRVWPPRGGAGVGRPPPRHDPLSAGLREWRHRRHGAVWIDQRHRPPHRAGPAGGHSPFHRRLRPDLAGCTGNRESAPRWRVSHGGFS